MNAVCITCRNVYISVVCRNADLSKSKIKEATRAVHQLLLYLTLHITGRISEAVKLTRAPHDTWSLRHGDVETPGTLSH